MIRMKAEAVVISKADLDTGLNGADVNMNGKVILADVMDKGYKGAGRLSGEIILCAAEGDREKKVAETAMNILSKHIPAIKSSGSSFRSEAETFFNHTFRELSMLEGEYSSLSATILYNFGGSVYVANCGKNAVYIYDGMYLTPVEFGSADKDADDAYLPDISYQLIETVTPNTQILVLSNEVYEYTTDEQILEILRSSDSVKQACQRLIDKSTENGATKELTVMIENLVPVDVPTAGVAAAETAAAVKAAETDEEEPDLTKPSKAPLIVLILLLVLVALIAGLYFFNQSFDIMSIFNRNNVIETEPTTVTEPAANLVTIATSATTEPESTQTTTEPEETDTPTTRRSSSTTTTTTRRSSPVISTETEPTEPEPSEEPEDPTNRETPSEKEDPSENEEPSSEREEPPAENNDSGELEDA